VGDDQRQHVELAREIARRFNSTYGDVLVEPEHVIPEIGARVMDLQDPAAKMSTSYGTEAGLIYIDDEPDAIRKKLGRAETDSGREVVRAPDKQGISNLIEIMAVSRGVAPEEIEREFEGEGYGAFKQAVAEAVVEVLAPVRERYRELRPDEEGLERMLAEGAERARAIAQPVIADVRGAMGIGPVQGHG
jgi:tryptophanyl-tRNA synthetase